jgi:hypothetical protein
MDTGFRLLLVLSGFRQTRMVKILPLSQFMEICQDRSQITRQVHQLLKLASALVAMWVGLIQAEITP